MAPGFDRGRAGGRSFFSRTELVQVPHVTFIHQPETKIADAESMSVGVDVDRLALRGGRVPLPSQPRDAVTLERRRRSEEHTSELQSRGHLVCRPLLEKNNKTRYLISAHIKKKYKN